MRNQESTTRRGNYVIALLFILFVTSWLSATAAIAATEPKDIALCSKDTECVVVKYSHCCGSSKRAINIKYKTEYDKNKSWQEFRSPACASMGLCRNDAAVTEAICTRGRCWLKWPQ